MDNAGYAVKTKVFEGPLDLLLELVSQRKLFVNDVSLAEVCDDFIRYIESREDFPLGESAEFILVASTLMLIKSRSLLPQLPLTEEEEENIHDLEQRLQAYAKFKELAQTLKAIFGQNIIFGKEGRRPEVVVFSLDSKTDIANLSQALDQVIANLPRKEVLPKVVIKKIISLEEMIEKLSLRISKAGKISFASFKHKDKISTIVGFLAMLELVKRGVIRATQETSGEIEIERESLVTPNYSHVQT